MRGMLAKVLAFFGLLLCVGVAHCDSATDTDVFEQMIIMGMPVSQAVAGVLANSPESAEAVVAKAFKKDANAVFDITSAALKAVPDAREKIIALAIKHDAKRSLEIINAVVKQAPGYTAQTVEQLIAVNEHNADQIIVQAADALSFVQMQRNQSLSASKILKSMQGL